MQYENIMDIKALFNNDLYLVESLRNVPDLARNLLMFILDKRSSGTPLFLTWTLTNVCQFQCRHCYREPNSVSLTRNERIKIAENIARSSVYWVSLTGGEPLMIPEIMEIVSILKRHNKKVTITTNGFLLNDFIKDIIDIKVDGLHISVDSHKREIHDYLRNTPVYLIKY